MNIRAQRGFTLYELLVTVLVAGIIFGLGVPNLLEFTRNNRMSATANDLITAALLARSEAVKQRVPVTLCMSPEPLIAVPVCDDDFSDADSEGGYVVWVDEDDPPDGVIDAGEQILLQRDDPQDITVLVNNGSGFIRFGVTGYVEELGGADSATEILLCDMRGNVRVSGTLSAARGVRIDPTGRASVLSEVDTIASMGDQSCT